MMSPNIRTGAVDRPAVFLNSATETPPEASPVFFLFPDTVACPPITDRVTGVSTVRKYLVGRRDTFSSVRKYFFGRRDTFSSVRKYFFGRRDTFSIVRKYFFGRRDTFSIVRKYFFGRRDTFSTVRKYFFDRRDTFSTVRKYLVDRRDTFSTDGNRPEALQNGLSTMKKLSGSQQSAIGNTPSAVDSQVAGY
jgi:hypothetical protein